MEVGFWEVLSGGGVLVFFWFWIFLGRDAGEEVKGFGYSPM